jgi:hypothetical protein
MACSGSVLNGALITATSNDQVLAYLETLWTVNAEIAAQIFAYEAVGNQGARPMNDKVLENGGVKTAAPRYLGCVEAWAKAELAGNSTPAATSSPSGACNTAPPM